MPRSRNRIRAQKGQMGVPPKKRGESALDYQGFTDDGREHYSIEQQTLGAEKMEFIRSADTDRTFAIVSSGAIWAWFVTNPLQGGLRWFYLLPFGIALLFILKRFAGLAAIKGIANYVRQMERQLLPTGVGWETWLGNNRTEWFRQYDIIFWVAICTCDVALAIALWSQPISFK